MKKFTAFVPVLCLLAAMQFFAGCRQAGKISVAASGPSDMYSGQRGAVSAQSYITFGTSRSTYPGATASFTTAGPISVDASTVSVDSTGKTTGFITAGDVTVDQQATLYATLNTGQSDSVVMTIHPAYVADTLTGIAGTPIVTIYPSVTRNAAKLLVYDYTITSTGGGSPQTFIDDFTATFAVPLSSFKQLSMTPPTQISVKSVNQNLVWSVTGPIDTVWGNWSEIKVEAIADGTPGGTASFRIDLQGPAFGTKQVTLIPTGPKP